MWMPFGIIGRTGPRMRKLVGFGNRSTGRGTFGVEFGDTIVTNGDLYGVHVQQRGDAALFKITLGRLVRIVTVLMLACSEMSCKHWSSCNE